jgi:hypothetical protein
MSEAISVRSMPLGKPASASRRLASAMSGF